MTVPAKSAVHSCIIIPAVRVGLSPSWRSKLQSEHGLSAEVCVSVRSVDSRLLIKDSAHMEGAECSKLTALWRQLFARRQCVLYLKLDTNYAISGFFHGFSLLPDSHVYNRTSGVHCCHRATKFSCTSGACAARENFC